MVTTGETSIFDNMPDLLSHLEAGYREATKQPFGMTCDGDRFITWAKTYLSNHRPFEIFPVDDNYGVRLTNGVRLKVCPDAKDRPRSGDMANPDTSISITRAR